MVWRRCRIARVRACARPTSSSTCRRHRPTRAGPALTSSARTSAVGSPGARPLRCRSTSTRAGTAGRCCSSSATSTTACGRSSRRSSSVSPASPLSLTGCRLRVAWQRVRVRSEVARPVAVRLGPAPPVPQPRGEPPRPGPQRQVQPPRAARQPLQPRRARSSERGPRPRGASLPGLQRPVGACSPSSARCPEVRSPRLSPA
ncbi:hypothetical protein GALL_479940 [mine drainage metagenome]|uniref:Uncharacterized protein n=1 Tax=mine drainage metagenome TaxID=410659 RepID=A0A1J5PYP4_9ZZZZ